MTKPAQDKKELEVFKSFSKHYPRKIKIESIKKKQPPEPDIECEIESGEKISFELVECVDNRIMKKWSDYIKLKKLLKLEIRNLSEDEKRELSQKYKGMNMLIVLKDNFSIRKKETSIKDILQYLLKRKKDISDIFGVFKTRSIEVLKEVYIYKQEKFNKFPDIDLPGIVTDFEEHSLKMIKNKLNKNYQTKNKIELLAYYHFQHDINVLGKKNFINVKKFIQENISQTSFTRIWLYSYVKEMVIYSYELHSKRTL